MASPTLGRLYPGEIPRYSFYRRLSGPQDQSEQEGVKKNLHPLWHSVSNPGRPAHNQAPCRLSHLAHKSIFVLFNNALRSKLCIEDIGEQFQQRL